MGLDGIYISVHTNGIRVRTYLVESFGVGDDPYYSLLTTHYLLLITYYSLPTTHYLLLTVLTLSRASGLGMILA